MGINKINTISSLFIFKKERVSKFIFFINFKNLYGLMISNFRILIIFKCLIFLLDGNKILFIWL
jgi:hypothetical protein